MGHDPMCPLPLCDYGDPEGDCMGYEDCLHRCQCRLIAAVRADERAKARQRVEALIEQARQSRDWRYDESYLNGLDDAAAAAGGDE